MVVVFKEGKRMKPILQAAALAVVALGTGASAVTFMNGDVPDFVVPEGSWQPGSALDGRAFRLSGMVKESGEEMPETVVSFVDGRFQSSRCQIYCEFGWQDYQTWTEGEVTRFSATTRCPDAPHTVVWYGTVEGDEMQFEGTWTTRRWYWTRQLRIAGQGTPAPAGAEATSG
jgi:hypothetical protein